MELHRIRSVEPSDDFTLRLEYDDGVVVRAYFSKLIRRGGVFAPLGAAGFFRRVKLRNGGRAVAWPGEIDFCADALRLNGERMDTAKNGKPRRKPGKTRRTV